MSLLNVGENMRFNEFEQIIQRTTSDVLGDFFTFFVDDKCWKAINALFTANIPILLYCTINFGYFHIIIPDKFFC